MFYTYLERLGLVQDFLLPLASPCRRLPLHAEGLGRRATALPLPGHLFWWISLLHEGGVGHFAPALPSMGHLFWWIILLHEVGVRPFATSLPSTGQHFVEIWPWRLRLASPAAPVASATPALYTLFQALARVDSASLPLHWPSRRDGGGEGGVQLWRGRPKGSGMSVAGSVLLLQPAACPRGTHHFLQKIVRVRRRRRYLCSCPPRL